MYKESLSAHKNGSASKGVEFLFDFYVFFLQSSIILTTRHSFCSCLKGILINSLSLSSVAEASGGARNWEMINVAFISMNNYLSICFLIDRCQLEQPQHFLISHMI